MMIYSKKGKKDRKGKEEWKMEFIIAGIKNQNEDRWNNWREKNIYMRKKARKMVLMIAEWKDELKKKMSAERDWGWIIYKTEKEGVKDSKIK